MIRFLPDSLRDAIWRPLAMAAPDGGVYVEIIAPDFRFLFILLLVVGWLVLARGNQRRLSPALILFAFTTLAFVPWLATSGNGRYFIPFLLIAGPLSIGLLHLLPGTRGLRLCLAVLMVAWQAFLVYQNEPWRSWNYVSWKEAPAFGIDVPPEVAAEPATYVTLASISYSLIAPRFHPESRWINISALEGISGTSSDELRAQALIAAQGPLKLIFPTVPGGQDDERIDPELGVAIDDLLARQGLSIDNVAQCRILRSDGLSKMVARRLTEVPAGQKTVHGFWLCPLARHASTRARKSEVVPVRAEQVFQKMEALCPRIFRPGEVVSLKIPAGAVRGYPGSDFKLYVLNDGKVWYKYVRALNPVMLGEIGSILDPAFKMDCDHIQGRSGLPWERGI